MYKHHGVSPQLVQFWYPLTIFLSMIIPDGLYRYMFVILVYKDFTMTVHDAICIQQRSFSRIGLCNDIIKYQGISEWKQTETRMMAYTQKGYYYLLLFALH